MDLRQLYDHSLSATLTEQEREQLRAGVEAHPYCSVLHCIQARTAGEPDQSLRELASVYARDRGRLNAYLGAAGKRSNGATAEAPQSALPEADFGDSKAQFEPAVNWRLDTFVSIWIERTRDSVQEVLKELKGESELGREPAIETSAETPREPESASMSPETSAGAESGDAVRSWVQKIAAAVQQQRNQDEESESQSVMAAEVQADEPFLVSDQEEKVILLEDADLADAARMEDDLVEATETAETEAAPMLEDKAESGDSREETDDRLETEQGKSGKYVIKKPANVDDWRDKVPDFVELDVSSDAEQQTVSKSGESSKDVVDQKAIQLENDIKARIRRAKDLLRRNAGAVQGAPAARSGESYESESLTQPRLDELRSNIRLIREATLPEAERINEEMARTGSLSPSGKSSYDPANFLERFIHPDFDPKAATLSAYRKYLTGEDEIPASDDPDAWPLDEAEVASKPNEVHGGTQAPEPNRAAILERIRTESFSRFVEPSFDVKSQTLDAPFTEEAAGAGTSEDAAISEGAIGSKTESFARFVEPQFDPKSETLQLPPRMKDDEPVLNALEVESAERTQAVPAAAAQTESFSRFVEPSFDVKVSAQAETQPLAEVQTDDNQAIAEEPAAKSASDTPKGPIERTRSESFSRFVEPEFTAETKKVAHQPVQEPQPTAEIPAEEILPPATSGPIERSRSESFSRFVEPEFTADTKVTTPQREAEPETVAEAPASEVERPAAATGPIERTRSESFSRFVEPEFTAETKVTTPQREIEPETVTEAPVSEIERPAAASGPIERTRSESFSRFVEPEFTDETKVTTPQREVEPEPVAEAPAPEVERPAASGLIERSRSESFSRFVEPEFTADTKVTTPQREAEPEPVAEAPASVDERPAVSGPIERTRSESFSRFVEPEFSDETKKAAPQPEAEPQPTAEAKSADVSPTVASGPIERTRSESFSRFVEPEFSGGTKKAAPQPEAEPQPTAEAKSVDVSPTPSSGPIERTRSESFSRFVEPEFSAGTKRAEQPSAETAPDFDKLHKIAAEVAKSADDKLKADYLERKSSVEGLPEVEKTAEVSAADGEESVSSVTVPEVVEVVDELIETTVQEIFEPVDAVADVAPELPAQVEEELAESLEVSSTEVFEPVQEFVSETETSAVETLGEPSGPPVEEHVEPLAETEVVKSAEEVVPAFEEDLAEEPQAKQTRHDTEKDAGADETTVVRYPHGGLTLEIRLKPDQLKYFRSTEGVGPAEKQASPPAFRSNIEEGALAQPLSIVSPELIKKRFEEQQHSHPEGLAQGSLEKVIIDYSKQTIEFVVEPPAPEPEPLPEPEQEPVQEQAEDTSAAIAESVEQGAEETPIVPPASAVATYDPEEIRSRVPDYTEFLLKALTFKDSYSEGEARTFLKLIYNRTEIQSADFLEQTFDLPRILTAPPVQEAAPEDIKSSQELLLKLSSIEALYAKDEESQAVAKEVSAEDAEDLEHASNEIDSRIDRFRSNLQRIRTKSAPGIDMNVSSIQDRFLSNVLRSMLDEEEATPAKAEEMSFSLEDLPVTTTEQELAASHGSVERVISTYESFEPILHAQIDRLRNREPELSELDDFSIEEDDEADLPTVFTESMARLLVQQGSLEQAQRIYERLKLKYPEKSDYFAAEIQRLIESRS